MKLKYYLRGLGVGILVTTVVLMIASSGKGKLSDQEIMERARELGMVMAGEEDGDRESEDGSEGAEGDEESGDEAEGDRKQQKADEAVSAGTDIGGAGPASGEAGSSMEEQEPDQDQALPDETVFIPIEVKKGEYSDIICEKLLAAGLITDVGEFNRYLMDNGLDVMITTGVHQIPQGADYETIAIILCRRQGNQ